jgi:hypothetical protein
MGALSNSYILSPNTTRLNAADETFRAAMAKYPTDAGYDGVYAAELDSNSTAFAINAKAKDFGFWWGVGGAPKWLAARVGGAEPTDNRTMNFGFQTGDIAAATKMRVTVKNPNAADTTVTCTSAPCTVSVDARLGQHLYRIEYLSSGDAVLAAGDWLPLAVRR